MSQSKLAFDSTLGAVFIGYAFSMLLYGVTCLQTGLFLSRSRRGFSQLMGIVLLLWTLDTLHIAITSHGVYTILISLHANPFRILKPVWTFGAQVYITVISNLLVRGVFSYRIWKLSHGNIILPVIVIILSLFVLATGFVFGTGSMKVPTWTDSRNFAWSMYFGYASEMLADLIIAIALSLLLIRLRTGLSKSDSLVQTFMIYSINTGFLTIICVGLSLITYVTLPNSFAFIGFYFVLSKLYINSLLGSLNTQIKSDEALATSDDTSGSRPVLTTAITIGGSTAAQTEDRQEAQLQQHDNRGNEQI